MKKILLIDDQQDNLISIKALLKQYIPDCKVFTALSGKAGIEIAIKEQPDVVLLDIVMPEMDGYQTSLRLKLEESTKDIPIIILTAIKTDTNSKVQALKAGADAFLTKPIDPQELTAQANVIFRIKESEDKLKLDKKLLEQKVLERTTELVESENKYRTLVESANQPIFTVNYDGTFLFMNKISAKMLRGKAEDLIGKSMWDLFPKELANGQMHTIREALDTGKLITSSRNSIVSGKEMWFEAQVIPIEKEGKKNTVALVMLTDITQRIKAQNELILSETKFRETAEMLPQIVFETDNSGKLTYVNQQAYNTFKYTKKDFEKGLTALQIIAHEDVDRAKNNMQKILEGKEIGRQEYRAVTKNGKIFPVLIHSSRIMKNEEIKGLRGIIMDITDLKKAEEELQKHREHLEDMVKQRTEELEKKNAELAGFNKLFVGREFRIKELRDQVKELEEQLGINN